MVYQKSRGVLIIFNKNNLNIKIKHFRLVYIAVSIVVVFAMTLASCVFARKNSKHSSTLRTSKVSLQKKIFRPYPDPTDLVKEGEWKKSSEKKAYPNLKKVKKLVIRVSVKGNRVYLLDNNKVIYTMLASCGKYKNGKSLTPLGKYQIIGGRGDKFFNSKLNEGALNWVSWTENCVYLFHSVPICKNQKINKSEAAKLGKQPASNGCIRLSLPDSKWLMDNVPTGTPVVIKTH